jgi:hypothetical protein
MLCEWHQYKPSIKLPPANVTGVPDPNERNSEESYRYWLALSDWYSDFMPYIIHYDSVEHLVQILNKITDAELLAVSQRMKLANRRNEKQLTIKWSSIVDRVEAAKNIRKLAKDGKADPVR